MGLTIHYGLKSDRKDADGVRPLVQEFRRLAQQLPFQEVGEVAEFQGEGCRRSSRDDPHGWLRIQAGQYLQVGQQHIRVEPTHVIAFTTVPGDGSEPANIGLARFPESIQIERHGKKQTQPTNLHGWSWHSFCKTQYASNSHYGGTANFVRCHLCVIGLLDAIKTRQLAQVDVDDESDFWDHRDVRRLATTVGEWNQMVAAAVGQIKDSGVFAVEAPITQYPDFEHLEAKGQSNLGKRTP
jgi:hypothetical protein